MQVSVQVCGTENVHMVCELKPARLCKRFIVFCRLKKASPEAMETRCVALGAKPRVVCARFIVVDAF